MLLNLLLLASIAINTINLDEDHIIIKGPINSISTNKFFNDVKDVNNNLTIFINSPGGSVMDGMKIIDHINMLQDMGNTVNCIADYSASMAFIILQSCTNRYALRSSVLMQHQMSLETQGGLYNMKNYLNMIDDIDDYLDELQTKKINMTLLDFQFNIKNDWWLTGLTAKEHNVIDELVYIKCDKSLYNKKMTLVYPTLFGNVNLEYSKCPLLRNPLKIIYDNNDNIEQVSNILHKDFLYNNQF